MLRSEPVRYVVARLREVLAQDSRTNVLDVEVKISGDQIFLLGAVESEERKQVIETVVRENVGPEMVILNELWVADYSHRTHAERVP